VGVGVGGGGWWRPPPTRPAARAQQTVSADHLARPASRRASGPTWPRRCGCMGCVTGSSRATSRSRVSLVGPTSRFARIGPSAGTGRWSHARSRFVGRHSLADHPGQPAAPDPPTVPTVARGATATRHRGRTGRQELLAGGGASGAGLADPLERAATLLAVVVASAAAPAAPKLLDKCCLRPAAAPLHPIAINKVPLGARSASV
jgi:hypothetical protein